jgi:hypothetical protein
VGAATVAAAVWCCPVEEQASAIGALLSVKSLSTSLIGRTDPVHDASNRLACLTVVHAVDVRLRHGRPITPPCAAAVQQQLNGSLERA